VTSTRQDAAVDNAAATAFFGQNGERATALPPVAIVIAAYNEDGDRRVGRFQGRHR
jgi:hypothetical protein